MERAIWTQTLNKYWCPPWPCPTCAAGIAKLEPKSLTFTERALSKRAHSEEWWDPNELEYVFVATAKCSNAKCGETFALSGVGGVEQIQTEEDWDWEDWFKPASCTPMPNIISIPTKCPESLATELRAAFQLFWMNPGACANRLRIALECLLDEVGVPRRKKDGAGKYQLLNLHKRIEAFSQRDSLNGGHIMALKWLGNTSSHEGGISQGEVLDALQILEHVLIELIEQRSKRVSELAKKLSKKHAP